MDIRKIIREEILGVLNEYELFDYKKTLEEANFIEYTFNTDGLVYKVQVSHSQGVHEHDVYEVGFGVEGEDEEGYRTKKDLEHLNSVLYTVDKIVGEVVREKMIRKIGFSGEKDKTDSHIPFIDNIRLKSYLRFVKNKYPNAKIDKDRFGNMSIDMRTIYPEVFEGKETRQELIVKELKRISDEEPNDWRLESNIKYDSEMDRVEGETDAIISSKYGPMLIGIDSNESWKEHSVNWEMFDSGEEGDKHFDNFDDLLKFLKSSW